MSAKLAKSTRVKGRDLRFLRKRRFPSAEAFSVACGSVSTPTVYRAERDGPVLMSYLATMARELGVDVEHLIAEETDPEIRRDLTGAWVGFYIGTDRFGQPYLIEEVTNLLQNGNTVEGHAVIETREGVMRDLFVDCFFTGNVFIGQTRSEQWPFPLDCATFVTSGIRNFTQLDGYISWFDLDTERPEFSRYLLIKRDSPNFVKEITNARTMLDDEIKLMRVRRLLEAGYSFEHSVDLITAVGRSPDLQNGQPVPTGPDKQKVIEDDCAEPTTDQTLVAVSSLVVLDPDPTQKFYADGLIDDIATDLARTPGLNVLPRSSFPSGKPVDNKAALSRNASHVLSGSLQRSDNRLRVNVQLVKAADGQIVWAERYEHPAANVFTAHEEISRDVISALSPELATASRGTSQVHAPDPHAYELFLKARSLYLRGIYTHSLRAAEALLVRAVRIDPDFARAFAQISICRSHLVLSISQSSGVPLSEDGASAAQRALNIDPNLPLGHAALGLVRYAAGDYCAAEEELRRSISLDPQLFEAHFFLARDLRLQGDRAGAAEFFSRASDLCPEDFRTTGLLAEELQALRRPDEARVQFRASLRSVECELENNPDNAGALAFGAAVLSNLGQYERAATWSEWALAIAPHDCFVQYNVARTYAIGGDPASAMTHLKYAFNVPPNQRRRLGLWLKFDEDFKELSGEPQFRELTTI